MKNILIAITYSVLILASGSIVRAEEDTGGWNFEVTPRFWYMLVNPNPFSDSQFIQQTNETAEFPLYGLSLRVEPPDFGGSDFLLTVFRGSDTVKGRSVNALGVSARHVTDATRTDVELLYRTRFPDSNAHWFLGARWVFLEEESDVGSGLVFPSSGTSHLSEESSFYLAEVGASYSVPMDRAANHLLFGNFTGGVGYETVEVTNRTTPLRPDDEAFFPFVDINVGYQYILSDSLNIHARYRAFVLEEIFRDLSILHGPEVGLTVKF
jgi:hypothetical protein